MANVSNNWNIVFITSDQHNAQYMGCAGDTTVKTPNLDNLAKQGTIFNNAYCAFPQCAPTRQSIYTGLYPQEHGQLSNVYKFDSRNLTWAHHFKKYGYYTAVIGKTHHNNPEYDLGFDYKYTPNKNLELVQLENFDDQKPLPMEVDPEEEPFFRGWLKGVIVRDELSHYDGLVTKKATEFLNQNADKKFFLHVSLTKPHWTFDATEEFYYMYDPEKINIMDVPDINPDDDPSPYSYYDKNKWGEISEYERKLFRARYFGSVSWMDHNVGRVLTTLKKLGLDQNTLVVYTSDHGEMAADHGLWNKRHMFEGSARVPLIMKMPGAIKNNAKSSILINHVDLFATFAGLVNAGDGLPEMTGKDYSHTIYNNENGADYTFSVEGFYRNFNRLSSIMARSKQYKVVRYHNWKGEGSIQYSIYDILNDPMEKHNLRHSPDHQDIIAEHSKAMNEFLGNLNTSKYEPVMIEKKKKK